MVAARPQFRCNWMAGNDFYMFQVPTTRGMPFADLRNCADSPSLKAWGSLLKERGKIMFPESVILVVGSESDESESIARMLSDRYRVIGVEKPDDALTHVNDDVDMVVSQLD